MFVLDTNVLSAMMGTMPAPAVEAWISTRPVELLFTAAICKAEILAGIAILPDGRRRSDLEAVAEAMFTDDFQDRVLPFDTDAALAYAEIFAARRRAGRPMATADLIIAAIARTQGASVVTRNVRDFEGCGLGLVDPWSA